LSSASEIVLPTIQRLHETYPEMRDKYGLLCSLNPTFRDRSRSRQGWRSQGYYGIEQGPIVLMVENYRSGFLWNLMKRCPYLVAGLERAGFAKTGA